MVMFPYSQYSIPHVELWSTYELSMKTQLTLDGGIKS